jgi:hypothetical protein
MLRLSYETREPRVVSARLDRLTCRVADCGDNADIAVAGWRSDQSAKDCARGG